MYLKYQRSFQSTSELPDESFMLSFSLKDRSSMSFCISSGFSYPIAASFSTFRTPCRSVVFILGLVCRLVHLSAKCLLRAAFKICLSNGTALLFSSSLSSNSSILFTEARVVFTSFMVLCYIRSFFIIPRAFISILVWSWPS